jgi:hypothetical protein
MTTTEPNPPQKSPPRTDATAQLMLLLARETLDAEQTELARTLVSRIEDWLEFARFSVRNKSIGFVYKHLETMPGVSLPEGLLAEIRAVARQIAMDQIATAAALRRFHLTCVAPLGAQYVYIKGPALAALYYDQPVLRPCGDIDILVGPDDYARVAQAALARGDRFLFPSEPPDLATDPADLDFMIRRSDVIMSFDVSGMLFEIHRHIEKTTPIFSEHELLQSAQTVRVSGAEVATLSTAWNFVYVCYHHSRHFWSRLHWVADLHAIQAHKSFDRSEALALAKSIGLLPTVEAALNFAALTDRPDEWPAHLGVTPAGIFLDACLRGLPGDSAFELEGWNDMFLFDFANPWQYDPRRKYVLWARSALRRLQPGCHQYARRRRPRYLEWLYYLENAAALSGNILKRGGLR